MRREEGDRGESERETHCGKRSVWSMPPIIMMIDAAAHPPWRRVVDRKTHVR